MKVSLFVTCLVDQFYPDVGVAVVRLLRRLGCDVDFPPTQTCCGQPAFNSGFRREAREVARNQVAAFADSEYVVSPSGSCTGMIHHYYRDLFRDDPAMTDAVERLIGKTYEFSQFVVDVLGVTDLGARFPHRVTYHPSCHGSRLLGVRKEPLALLQSVQDIDLAPLEGADDCCGFGGTFAVKMSALSGAMVADKAANVGAAQAEYLVSTDMGCLMNISGYLKKRQSPVQSLHLAELLYRATTPQEPRP